MYRKFCAPGICLKRDVECDLWYPRWYLVHGTNVALTLRGLYIFEIKWLLFNDQSDVQIINTDLILYVLLRENWFDMEGVSSCRQRRLARRITSHRSGGHTQSSYPPGCWPGIDI